MRLIRNSCLFAVCYSPFLQGAALPQSERYALITDKASSSLLLDICRLPDSDRLVAVGDRGHILFSDDSGKKWTQARVPTTQMLTAVTFTSARTGFAVGHDNLILKTDDAGASWRQVYQDIDQQAPLLDIWFQNDNRGIAIGAYGVILQTIDGGNSWKNASFIIENEEEFHLNAISSNGANHVFLAGESGVLYRSIDAGKSWQTLESPYDGSLFGISSHNDEVLIHGLRGNVFRSQNGGDSWQQVQSGTKVALFGSGIFDGGRRYLVGKSGSVLVGNKGYWQTRFRPDRRTLMALAAAPDGTIVVVGQGGVHRLNNTVDVAAVNKVATSR